MTRSLIGLIILVLDIWAIVQLFKSKASSLEKLLWTILIIVLPVVGLIIWYFIGPGNKKV